MASSSDTITAFKHVLRRDPAPADITHYASWPTILMVDNVISSNENTVDVHPVIRMYQSVFGRRPDSAGLDYWVQVFRTGGSGSPALVGIAGDFLAATEGQMRYPNGDPNITFVQKLYLNIFGRTGDVPGVAFYTNQLDTNTATRAQLITLFSEHAESTTRLATPIFTFQKAIGSGDMTAYDDTSLV